MLTTALGTLGGWHLWQRRRLSLAAWSLLPLILFPLPYYITHAEFRYRLVVDPLLTILAAHWVCDWINCHAKERAKRQCTLPA